MIGRGATGTVYLAEDTALRRYVALKVLLGNLARNPSLVRLLQLEAKAAAPLQHPNIVRIYSAGIDQGVPYISMEYVEGEPLDRFLKRHGRLHWTNAFYIAGQVAEALRYTHSRGIIHRDVKPANILLDRNGRARLTDFGIANIQAEEKDLPEASGFLGTPHYMSPEQAESRTVTATSDLYSLGIMLYQMLAGELPFTSDTPMGLVKAIVHDVPPRLNRLIPDIPDDVARLVAHLIEKRPEARPRDAEAVCKALARLQQEGGGKSALPSALNAFIREQAEIRTLPIVAQRRAAERKAPRDLSRLVKKAVALPAVRAAGAVLLAMALAVPPVLAWSYSPAHGRAYSAPALRQAKFERSVGPVRVARLGAQGLRLEQVGWTGHESVAVGRAVGIDGTLTQGAVGLFGADPQARKAWSLRPPAGSAFDAAPPQVRTMEAWSAAPHGVPAGTPLQGALLLRAVSDEGAGGRHVSLVAQRWNESAPRAQELYRTAPADGADPGASIRHAVIRPDGYTVCLLLREPLSNNGFLAERDVRWEPLDRVGPRLSPAEGAVLPQSVQYSPDGSLVAFILETAPNRRELWTASSGRGADSGIKVIEGPLADTAAFSPDGQRLAVSMHAADGTWETTLVRTDGVVEKRLGPGLVGSQSWHPSGRYLVAALPDAYALETGAPYRRAAVPGTAGGAGAWAVSSDGAWAAAPKADADVAAVFVELDAVRFGGAAQ